jgi:MFS transporter, PPP family, 3-phenylpropionic acid transporter
MMFRNQTKYFITFLLLYAFSYMCNAAYSIYIPVYLTSAGYSKTSIGILLSLAPIIAIIAQPLWGTFTDRSKNKNTVLLILILGSTFSILLYRLSINFFYLSVVISCFTLFQTSINPMSDAIALEYTAKTKWKFGHIRLAGTIGYSIMAVTAGILLSKNINRMFILYFMTGILTFIAALFLPKVKGHQSHGKKLAFWSLFKDRKLILYLSFALIIQMTLGYYYTFFSIYYQQLGAAKTLIGWSNFVAAMSETPFLLFSHVLLKKIKTSNALIIAGSAAALRWLLLGLTVNTYSILVFQLLHGLINIVVTVSLAMYINEFVPDELKASGQALNGLICTGIARIVGSLLGGYFSDVFGIQNMFIYNSIFVFTTVLMFIIIVSGRLSTKKFHKHR